MKTYEITFSGPADRAGPFLIAADSARQACDQAAVAHGCTLTGREVIECKRVGIDLASLGIPAPDAPSEHDRLLDLWATRRATKAQILRCIELDRQARRVSSYSEAGSGWPKETK